MIEEQLYFKVDKVTRPQFEAAQLHEWIYEKDGKPVHMNYFRPPEDVYDEEDSLRWWGKLALEAALRSRKPMRTAQVAAKPARAVKAGKVVTVLQDKLTPLSKSGQKNSGKKA